jgi:arylsulfatase
MPRNILLIMTDQQRFDSLGCYGCTAIETPNLDRLAAQGALFTQCYVNNPICTPSRASIFTGKPLPGHGVYRLHDDLPLTERPFPSRLQAAGYATALFGKLHLSSRVFEQDRRHRHDGFDVYEESKAPYLPPSPLNAYLPWLEEHHPAFFAELRAKGRHVGHFPEEAHPTRWVGDRTVQFLTHHVREKPFFCYASFFDPHDPYNDHPLSAEQLVNRERLPAPLPGPADWSRVPEGIRREHDHSYLGGFDSYTSKDIETMRVGYLASVAFIDREVGRILDTLDRLRYADDTLVIFTSDHGDMLGDHGLLAKGGFFYEPCVRVPLIVRAPGAVRPGTVHAELVQGHDIASTILHAAGVDETETRSTMPDSRDLIAALGGATGDANGHGAADWATAGEGVRSAVCLYRGTGISDTKLYFDPPVNAAMYRHGDYKLNLYFSSTHSGAPAGQLFDLTQDPEEQHDLWDDPAHAGIRADLVLAFTTEVNEMDLRYGSARGGEHFPPRSHWSENNPL